MTVDSLGTQLCVLSWASHCYYTCMGIGRRKSGNTLPYQDSGFPCFKGGPRAIQNLRKRFHLSLTEEVSIHYKYWFSFSAVSFLPVIVISFYLLAAMCIFGAFAY